MWCLMAGPGWDICFPSTQRRIRARLFLRPFSIGAENGVPFSASASSHPHMSLPTHY